MKLKSIGIVFAILSLIHRIPIIFSMEYKPKSKAACLSAISQLNNLYTHKEHKKSPEHGSLNIPRELVIALYKRVGYVTLGNLFCKIVKKKNKEVFCANSFCAQTMFDGEYCKSISRALDPISLRLKNVYEPKNAFFIVNPMLRQQKNSGVYHFANQIECDIKYSRVSKKWDKLLNQCSNIGNICIFPYQLRFLLGSDNILFADGPSDNGILLLGPFVRESHYRFPCMKIFKQNKTRMGACFNHIHTFEIPSVKIGSLALTKDGDTSAISFADNCLKLYQGLSKNSLSCVHTITTENPIVDMAFIKSDILWALDTEGTVIKCIKEKQSEKNYCQKGVVSVLIEKNLPKNIVAIAANKHKPRLICFLQIENNDCILNIGDIVNARYAKIERWRLPILFRQKTIQEIRNLKNWKIYFNNDTIVVHPNIFNGNSLISRGYINIIGQWTQQAHIFRLVVQDNLFGRDKLL